MNKSYFYIPFSFLVVVSIVLIALEMKFFKTMTGLSGIMKLAIGLALLTSLVVFLLSRKKLDFENLYVLIGSSLLFTFVIYLGLGSFLNRAYASNHCESASYEVLGYTPRFVSGAGVKKGEKIKANQWWLYIDSNGKQVQLVLEEDIFEGAKKSEFVELNVCKGFLGTRYFMP